MAIVASSLVSGVFADRARQYRLIQADRARRAQEAFWAQLAAELAADAAYRAQEHVLVEEEAGLLARDMESIMRAALEAVIVDEVRARRGG